MALATVIIIVGVLGLALALGFALRPDGGLRDVGRRGGLWFDRAGDLPVEARPSEDDRDAPIPQRPLRGRPR